MSTQAERVDQRRTDTREQIRAVALDLFAEKGYEGTSLREIAERLGFTKAAVYYHFRSKEEILASLVEEFIARFDELLHWAQERAEEARGGGEGGTGGEGDSLESAAFRVEVLTRYSELLSGRGAKLARFMHDGPSTVRALALDVNFRARMMALIDLLTRPGEDRLTARLRARVAVLSLHVGTRPDPGCEADDSRRRRAALAVATELLSPTD